MLWIAGCASERRYDLIGIDRLREVVRRAQLDRFHRGSHAGVAGEHHDPHALRQRFELGDQSKAGFPRHLQIDHRILRLPFARAAPGVRSRVCNPSRRIHGA
jgi:hypothetical protein